MNEYRSITMSKDFSVEDTSNMFNMSIYHLNPLIFVNQINLRIFCFLNSAGDGNLHFFQEWMFIKDIWNSTGKLVMIQVPEIRIKEYILTYSKLFVASI